MRLIILFIWLLFLSGCCLDSESNNLSGQPSWYPLGGEVYHTHKISDVQKEVLKFVKQPRWFRGTNKLVSRDEFENWQRNIVKEVKFRPVESENGKYEIPLKPTYPKIIDSLPKNYDGVTLDFRITTDDNPEVLIFDLTLKSERRKVSREVEHRWNNVTPFLFAFFADGKAISIKPDKRGTGKFGGINGLIKLAEPGTDKIWKLKISAQSINDLVKSSTNKVTVVASFSERQHLAYPFLELLYLNNLGNYSLNDTKPQITVRSNVFHLKRINGKWVPVKKP